MAPLPNPLHLALPAAFLAAAPGTAPAQVPPPPATYAVTAWTIAEGIPQTDIRTLALDGDGYLWIGTNVGLTRFDGSAFDDYPRGEAAGPPDAAVWALAPDGRGGLWALWPRWGVGRIGPDGTVQPPAGSRLPDFRFLDFAVGPGDTAWVTTGSGLRRFAGGEWTSVPGLPDGAVGEALSVATNRDGAVWVGGTRGLFRAAPPSGGGTARIGGLACEAVMDLAPAADGGVWVATCRGVEHASADGATVELVIPRPRGVPPQRITVGDEPGVLWVGDQQGVHRFRASLGRGGTQLARPTFDHGLDLQGSPIVALVGDGSGGVWVGTRSAGLRHVRRLMARRLGVADGLPDRPVHHLAPDGRGGLWIGTGRGLARWRDGRIRVHRPPDLGLEDELITGLLRDRAGALWIGQPGALVRVDTAGRGGVVVRLPAGPHVELAPVLEDRRGRLWFASSGGDVGYVDVAGRPAVMVPRGLLPTQRVWSVVEDAEGGVWVGQEGHLTRLRDTLLARRLTEADSVPPGPVRGLRFDADGALWIASYGGGLARWTPARGVERVQPGGGRFSRMASSLLIDRDDRFWVFGDGGLQILRRAELAAALAERRPARAIVEVGAEAGVTEGNGGFPSTWLDPRSGWYWAATVDGVAAVDTASFPFAPGPAHARIDEIRVDDRTVQSPDSVVVPAGARALDIWFSSPRFGGRSTDRLRYRLAGHDRDWIDAGTARVARYASLPPGGYVFEVVVERASRPVPSSRQAVRVRVVPHWWETPVARALAAVLGATLLWLLVRRVTRGLRRRNRALQREIAAREQAERLAADAARDLAHVSRLATAGELATSIAHELNQPLTAIMGSAQRAQRLADAPGDRDLSPVLDAIVDQAERAANVIHSLRAFVVKRTPEADLVAIEAVVTDTLRLLAQELRARGIAVHFRDERSRRDPVQGTAVQLQQVLVNLLLNAAEAMGDCPPEQREVLIRVADDVPDAVHLWVADRGPGIPPQDLPNLFEPFFTTRASGLGLGLSLSRSIVEAHAGRLWAVSPAEGGAEFHLVLPLAGTTALHRGSIAPED